MPGEKRALRINATRPTIKASLESMEGLAGSLMIFRNLLKEKMLKKRAAQRLKTNAPSKEKEQQETFPT